MAHMILDDPTLSGIEDPFKFYAVVGTGEAETPLTSSFHLGLGYKVPLTRFMKVV